MGVPPEIVGDEDQVVDGKFVAVVDPVNQEEILEGNGLTDFEETTDHIRVKSNTATASNDSMVEVGIVAPIQKIAAQVENEEKVLSDKEQDGANIEDGKSETSSSDANGQTNGSQSSEVTMADRSSTSGSPPSIALISFEGVSKQRIKKIKSKLRREQEKQNRAATENTPAEVSDNVVGVDEPKFEVIIKTPNNVAANSVSESTDKAQQLSGAEKQMPIVVKVSDNVVYVDEIKVKVAVENPNDVAADDVSELTENNQQNSSAEKQIPIVDKESVENPVEVLTRNQRNKRRSKLRREEEEKVRHQSENSNLDVLQHSGYISQINGPVVNPTSVQNRQSLTFHTTKQRKDQKRLANAKAKTIKSPIHDEITTSETSISVSQTTPTKTEEITTVPDTTLTVEKTIGTPPTTNVPTAAKKSSKSTGRTKTALIIPFVDRDVENQAIISTYDRAELTENGDILVHVKGRSHPFIVKTESERRSRLMLAARNARIAELDKQIAEADAKAAIVKESTVTSDLVSEEVNCKDVSNVTVKDMNKKLSHDVSNAGVGDIAQITVTLNKDGLAKDSESTTTSLPELPVKNTSTAGRKQGPRVQKHLNNTTITQKVEKDQPVKSTENAGTAVDKSKNMDKPARSTVVIIDSKEAADLILLARLSEPGTNGPILYSLFRDHRPPGMVFKVLE
ncbi:hypothetical protein HDU76_004335 [Blyttiomyces sp. JEL0837]|nr:hypothetical protein HDU76_004335 [Blyttiomyces sp. JEL0837]